MISVELTFTLIKKSLNIKLLFEPSLANIKVVRGTYGEKTVTNKDLHSKIKTRFARLNKSVKIIETSVK